MEPLISVIIPAYNIENYIERCLGSVCGQTYRNLEIIVVDDGSKDQTGTVIDRMARKDLRIVPVHKMNEGVSAARNTGLDRASGKYIGFVDGDDFIEENMYEFLLKNAQKYQADISHCGYQMVFPNRVDYYHNTGIRIVQDQKQGIYDLLKGEKVEPGLCNKLYKREVIGEYRLDPNIKINEDLLFNYFLFKNSFKSVFEDIPLYHYVIRANSASTSKINLNKLMDPLRVIKRIMQQETGDIYCVLEKRYLYLLEKVSTDKRCRCDETFFACQKEKRRELKEILRVKSYQADYGNRELMQFRLAAYVPILYRILHAIYAAWTGSRNKYKV